MSERRFKLIIKNQHPHPTDERDVIVRNERAETTTTVNAVGFEKPREVTLRYDRRHAARRLVTEK